MPGAQSSLLGHQSTHILIGLFLKKEEAKQGYNKLHTLGPQRASGHSSREHFPKQLSLPFFRVPGYSCHWVLYLDAEADMMLSLSLTNSSLMCDPTRQLKGRSEWLILNSSVDPEHLFHLCFCASESTGLRAGGGCPGGWDPISDAGLGQPPGAHLVLPTHALDVRHLVTPVLLQDPGLLVRQVAQLLGAALEVVVEAAQALPSPDGGFLRMHTGERQRWCSG